MYKKSVMYFMLIMTVYSGGHTLTGNSLTINILVGETNIVTAYIAA